MKLKAQLHCHSRQDPRDKISYSEKQLIDHAAKLGYHVLAITCHNVVIYNDQLFDYAKQKGIILIPGIEKDIEKKHVLILNATVEAQYLKTFKDLEKYREKHPEVLVVAAHPFFWSKSSLKSKLITHIKLFDAIEDNYYRSKHFNNNLKAYQVAEEYNLPVIGTADVHSLKYMDETYSMIDVEKETVSGVIKAIKKGKVEVVSRDLKIRDLLTIPLSVKIKNFVRRTLLLS